MLVFHLYLILTRSLTQVTTLQGTEDFLQLGSGTNIPRDPLSYGCGLSENLSLEYKGATSLGKVRIHIQKSVPMCILGTKKDSLRLLRFEQSCQFANDPQMWYFTGATTAGLYICFVDKGVITAAI
jgi:hypothetical protein